ncbi:MAG TPA: malectin domain-containing carbohydrate-binding protein [Candidatus Saccharimonadales bacterium]|nr:malectin domain-containing carbohydrate-binding protein [Candidatus Saccharimonadales bacterium]
MTTASDGNVWFSEYLNDSLARVTPNGIITEFSIGQGHVETLAADGSGNIWFSPGSSKRLGKMTTSGATTMYTLPTTTDPRSVTTTPNGDVWFTEFGAGKIGRFVPSTSTFTEYAVAGAAGYPASDQQGNVWFTDNTGNNIIKVNPDGSVAATYFIGTNSFLNRMAADPSGNIWFTETTVGKLGRLSTNGTVTIFNAWPNDNFVHAPRELTIGPDGNMWFSGGGGGQIGRITPAGVIAEYMPPYPYNALDGITLGADGNLWYTDEATNTIGTAIFRPQAPTNLTASSPTQHPALSWNAVPSVSSYNVYRDGTTIGSATSTSYTDNSAADGTHSYYVTAISGASESLPSSTISVLTDHTTPTITYAVTPVADSSGYNTGNVAVTFTCADNADGSGVASCTSPVTVTNEGIGQTVDGTATDNAGNSTTIHANASLLVQAINAGDSAAGHYSADTAFSGGTSYTTTAAVDESGVTVMPAPQGVYQSVRYGNFSYTLPGLTPNASYTLRLHFNELYWNGAGSRVFNVTVNGQAALTNYDIFDAAGGANRAVVEQLPVTADANGVVTIDFTTVTDNAMVNGIELYQGTIPPAPTPPIVTSALINAGGNAAGSFAADADFSGGTSYTSSASVDMSDVTSPAPEAVYQSVRYGNFSYVVPNLTPGATFQVRLHFNELYWGTALAGGNGGSGSRVFNVSINGSPALTNYDIYQAAGGANKATTETLTATADSHGRITIQFTTVTDNAMVNGIEVTSP